MYKAKLAEKNVYLKIKYQHHGLSIIEIIILLLILLLLLGLFLPALSRARQAARTTMCMAQLKQLQMGLIVWAQQENNEYPNPLEYSRTTADKCQQKGNSTANVYSLMIWNNFYSPELTVCPSEKSEFVQVYADYDYGIMGDNGINKKDKWDWDFSCDITGKSRSARTGKYYSNVSYANLALIGKRVENEWRVSGNTQFVVFGDRGPTDGKHDSKSITYLNHGTSKLWKGSLAFNDGHIELFEEQVGTDNPFGYQPVDRRHNEIKPDNIFAEDDVITRADIWLIIAGESNDKMVSPLWDANSTKIVK